MTASQENSSAVSGVSLDTSGAVSFTFGGGGFVCRHD